MSNLGRTLSYALILALIGASGCAKDKNSADRPVRIGYLPIIAHLPGAVAAHEHMFGDARVEFRVFGNSNDLLSALDAGDIDVATTVAVAPVARLMAKRLSEKAQPQVLIFSYSVTGAAQPFDSVFVRADSKIDSLRKICGQRVGVFPGTTAKNMLAYMLRLQFGIKDCNIEWVHLSPNVQIDALQSGDIAALYTYETTRTIAELRGMKLLYGSVIAAVQEGAPYGSSALNRAFAEKHPKLAAKIVDGFDRGVETVRSKESEGYARKVLQDDLGVARDVAERCNLEYRLTTREIGEPSHLKALQAFLGHLQAAGEIPSPLQAEDLIWRR